MKIALVTAGNSPFVPLIRGLFQSVRAFGDLDHIELCLLDVGLTADERAKLAAEMGTSTIVTPGWDLDFPTRTSSPEWFRAMVARPHLPRHFPGYDVLLWIDADAWVCSPAAVELLVKTAVTHGMAVVPEIDRSYSHLYGQRPGVEKNVSTTLKAAYGDDVGGQLARLPIINSGVFAMRADHPGWAHWSEALQVGLRQGPSHLVEQRALNLAIYSGRIQAQFLPAWCNWNCAHQVPTLDPATRILCHPLPPHELISICHLTDLKGQRVDVPCVDGTVRELELTYECIRMGPLPDPKHVQRTE